MLASGKLQPTKFREICSKHLHIFLADFEKSHFFASDANFRHDCAKIMPRKPTAQNLSTMHIFDGIKLNFKF